MPRRRNEDTVHVTVVGEPDKEFLFQVYDMMTRKMSQQASNEARDKLTEEHDTNVFEAPEALQ